MSLLETRIRTALKNRIRKYHKNSEEVLILDEFSIANGQSRIDIAVLNNIFHGYEIKSDKDTLERLPFQISYYNKIFNRITLIVGYQHAFEALNIIPEWWGVLLYEEQKNGIIHFSEARRNKKNQSIDKFILAQLLRKDEAIKLLTNFKIPFNKNTSSKKEICNIIALNLLEQNIIDELYIVQKAKINPLSVQIQVSYGDSFQPEARL